MPRGASELLRGSVLGEAQSPRATLPPMPGDAGPEGSHGHCPAGNLPWATCLLGPLAVSPSLPVGHYFELKARAAKEVAGWASLVAQWLRICLPMQGTQVRALVWEDPTCRGATRPVSHNY